MRFRKYVRLKWFGWSLSSTRWGSLVDSNNWAQKRNYRPVTPGLCGREQSPAGTRTHPRPSIQNLITVSNSKWHEPWVREKIVGCRDRSLVAQYPQDLHRWRKYGVAPWVYSETPLSFPVFSFGYYQEDGDLRVDVFGGSYHENNLIFHFPYRIGFHFPYRIGNYYTNSHYTYYNFFTLALHKFISNRKNVF